jgi:hypothetical protein
MKIKLLEKFIMNTKRQRDVLLFQPYFRKFDMCAPPSYYYQRASKKLNERISLWNLKGSLAVEAAMILPFFLMILISFITYFSKYASAAQLQQLAAAEAKEMAMTIGVLNQEASGDVTIYKTGVQEDLWINPFEQEKKIIQHAVCRPWIGFTKLEIGETYVYITPDGSVYHLFSDCTHLKLSVRQVARFGVTKLENEYGENYSPCELCKGDFGLLVYITLEGNRYHAGRDCGGLKRTIRQIPMSQVDGRRMCLRCGEKELM